MGEFGDRLRREREMRGITLEEISDSTKISRRRLEALENEEFDLLPGGVFNRGFVRSYARYVGLDPDQAIADYVIASHEQPPPEDRFPLEVEEAQAARRAPPLNPRRSWLPIAVAVLAFAGVVFGWMRWSHHDTKRVADLNAGVVPANAATAAPQPARPELPGAQAASKPSSANATPAGNSASSSAATPGPRALAPDKQAPAKPRSYTLAVTAKSDSWVSIVADGKTVMEGVLDANQGRSVKFVNQLVLHTGNAGGLRVSYNGKSLGDLGAENQVRTLRFPPKPRDQ